MRTIRIVVIGDELLTGAGDPKGMGWLGRVQARMPQGADVSLFSLPMTGETSGELLERWRTEALPRFSAATENFLVVAMGSADSAAGISISRSRLNLASILDDAKREGVGAFVVGPAPSGIPELDFEIEHLSAGFEDVVSRRGLNYVDCFHPLLAHEGWLNEVSEHPRRLPGQVGYGLIAWLVLNRGWFDWLGLTDPS